MHDLAQFERIGGVVIHGDKRGRLLGFPTANIAVTEGAPRDGVYSAIVRLPQSGRVFGGTASIGKNPTFDDVETTRVEAHIHGFDETLYGVHIELFLVMPLRAMQRFPSVEALIAQTQLDVDASIRHLKTLGL
jgi:riboflavin kinase/FMN adenylyltransferase